MKYNRLISVFLSLLMLLSLSACKSYADDIDTDNLATVGLNALVDGIDYAEADDGFLDDYFIAPAWVTDYEIYLAPTASNINQVGVYHVQDGHAEELETILSDYLKKSYEDNGNWYNSYIPKETPKLRDAEVKVFGNYVVYAILNQTDREVFFGAVEDISAYFINTPGKRKKECPRTLLLLERTYARSTLPERRQREQTLIVV